MDALIEQIRTAIASDASAEARTAGASACRAILAALEAKPGEAIAAPVPAPPIAVAPAINALGAALRGMPLDQLLDMAIGRLRVALPPGSEPISVNPIRFQLVPIVPGGGRP